MILVFLHGKGDDCTAYSRQLAQLADNLSAERVAFNAPFKCSIKPGKFVWFNKIERSNRKVAVENEYLFSIQYIKEKLRQLDCRLSDIVLIGHSQGGGMAVAAGLELNLRGVFSICGDLPYNLEYQNKTSTPIYWLEGKQDTYISQERKDSYKILQKIGADFCYQLLENCSHTEINQAFTEIEKIIKEARDNLRYKMRIININGPINSGKSTIAKMLQAELPNCLFVEVDELLPDEEEEKLNLRREEGWAERLNRLDKILAQEKNLGRYENIVFSYPMTEKNYRRWNLQKDENREFINITLAPKLEICLQNRGVRELTAQEIERIKEMYREGYNCPKSADLIIDNSVQTPEETLQKVLFCLKTDIRPATPDDAYAIKKIHVETYKKSYRGYIPDEYLDNMTLSDELIERTKKYLATTECLLALYEGNPVAFAYVTYPEDNTFEINALYVHPQYQKCGAGSRLVSYLCKDKKEKGWRKCVVWTMKSGSSLTFYEKLNFRLTNEEKLWKFDIPIIKLAKEL